jgi:hypothetical protein
MEYNSKRGAASYDFLAGASDYKRALASEGHTLETFRLQRKRTKLEIEESIVQVYRYFKRALPAVIAASKRNWLKGLWALLVYVIGAWLSPAVHDIQMLFEPLFQP